MNILSSMAIAAVREGFYNSEDDVQSFVDFYSLAPSPSRTQEVKELLLP